MLPASVLLQSYPIRALRCGVAWCWGLVSLLVFIPIALIALPLDREYRCHDLLARAWARGFFWIGGVGLRVSGHEHVARSERYVVVCNHQSALDIPALILALSPHTSIRFVAKRSLFKMPIIGWGMYAFGHKPMDRENIRAAMKDLANASGAVESRHSIVFFPEGTRTRDGTVGRFSRGAFYIAARNRVRILPVSITGAYRALPAGHYVLAPHAMLEMRIHGPMSPSGQTNADMHDLTRSCQDIVTRGCEDMGAATSPAPGADPTTGASGDSTTDDTTAS